MEQNKERVSNNKCVLTLYDFVCLFIMVLRENDEEFFYLTPLSELMQRLNNEGKYIKLLENIKFDDSFIEKFEDVLEKLNGLIIKYGDCKKMSINREEIEDFFDELLARFVKFLDNMFMFVDDYYLLLDNEYSELLVDEEGISNKARVRIL